MVKRVNPAADSEMRVRKRTDIPGAWPYGLHCIKHEPLVFPAHAVSVNVKQ